jgi:hypothetical protein
MKVGERIKSLLIHKVDFGKRRKREKNKGVYHTLAFANRMVTGKEHSMTDTTISI